MVTHQHDQPERPADGSGRTKWVLIGFLAIGGYFLFTEHRAHLQPYLAYLPFLLLLACPLLHMFHGHGGHGSHGQDRERDARPSASPRPRSEGDSQ